LVCIRRNISFQFRVSGFKTRNWKPGNLKLLFRIAIPAPHRKAQEELNTLTSVSGFKFPVSKPPASRL
jgi:hypothetical protein